MDPKKWNFLLLLYVTTLTFATMYSPQPLLSTIHAEYPQHSGSTIALLMAVTLMPLSIAPLIYGSYLSSFDTRHVLLVCTALLAVGGWGLYFFQSFSILLAVRAMQGLVIPAMLTCLMAQISGKFQGTELQRAMSIYVGITILGGVVGRVLCGGVATWVGWRYSFLVLSVALLLALIPLWRMNSCAKPHIAHVRLSEFVGIIRTPGIGALLIIEACGLFIYSAVSNYLPFRITEIGSGVSEWRIGLMYLGNVIGVFMAFGSRWFIHTMGSEVRAIRLGLCVLLCALPGLLTHNLWALFLAMCAMSMGEFLAHSISPGLINRMTLCDKAAVNGLYLSVYYMGGALGSYLPGLVYGLWGWVVFTALLMVVMFIGIMCTRGLGRHIPHI